MREDRRCLLGCVCGKHKHQSEETRLKRSLAHSGQLAWNKGVVGQYSTSEETKRKQSVANQGKPKSKETCRKLSIALLGKNKGKPSPMKDKHHSEKTRRGISLKLKGRSRGKCPSNCTCGRHFEETKTKIRLKRREQVFPLKDTSIEIRLQNALKESGIEFTTHKAIRGQPDLFIEPNLCIFTDGCYWHCCPKCGFEDYKDKRLRDEEVSRYLQKEGYVVLRFWEHDIISNLLNCLVIVNQEIEQRVKNVRLKELAESAI